MATPLQQTYEETGEGMPNDDDVDCDETNWTELLSASLRLQKLMYIADIIMEIEEESLDDLMAYSRSNLSELLDDIHNDKNNNYRIKVSHRNKFAKIVTQFAIKKQQTLQNQLAAPSASSTTSKVKLLFLGKEEEEAIQSIQSGQEFIDKHLIKIKESYNNLNEKDKTIKRNLDEICNSIKQQIDTKQKQMISSIDSIYQYHLNKLNQHNEVIQQSAKITVKFYNEYQNYFTDNKLTKLDRKDKLIAAKNAVHVEMQRLSQYKNDPYNINIVLNKDVIDQFFGQYMDLKNIGIDLPSIKKPKVKKTLIKWVAPKFNQDIMALFSNQNGVLISYQILYSQEENEEKTNDEENEWRQILIKNDGRMHNQYEMMKYVPCKVKIQYMMNNIVRSPESEIVKIKKPKNGDNDDEKQGVMQYDPIITRTNSNGYIARLGSTGKYYCAKAVSQRCTCCDGRCGPTNGCNCASCMELDIKYRMLPKGFLVNKSGFNSRISNETGRFYCGRKCGQNTWECDGFCGPTNGPNCNACRKLDNHASRIYGKLFK